jgi:ABC-type phosphate/phosphonate transport system substrate-binding protein
MRKLHPPSNRITFQRALAMSKLARAGLLVLFLAVMALSSSATVAEGTAADADHEIRVGFFMDPIDKTDRTDLKHTLDVWTDGFATERFSQTRISIYENESQFRQALHSGTIDVGFIYSYQYSTFAVAGSDPAAVVGRDVEPTVQFVLLVGKDNGVDNAKDLKGKKI